MNFLFQKLQHQHYFNSSNASSKDAIRCCDKNRNNITSPVSKVIQVSKFEMNCNCNTVTVISLTFKYEYVKVKFDTRLWHTFNWSDEHSSSISQRMKKCGFVNVIWNGSLWNLHLSFSIKIDMVLITNIIKVKTIGRYSYVITIT